MIALRPLSAADSENLLRWRNLPEVREFMYADHEISRVEHERWLLGALSDDSRKYWVIVCDGEDVGTANLYAIDRKNKRCHWAFYLASPSVRGKGVGSAVEWAVIEKAFTEMGLNRLCCEVLTTNPAVIAMHKKFGFTQEGLFREHAMKNGVPVDVASLGLLKSDWSKIRPQVEARLREKGVLAA